MTNPDNGDARTGQPIRITQDGKTITSFDRDSHGAWREKLWTSPLWRKHDDNRPHAEADTMDEQLPHRARFYGVGLVDLPNGQTFRVETQHWQWHGSGTASSTTHAQPVHGRRWDDDRTIRVVYEFPGLTVRHEKLTPILDGLEANGRDYVSVAALRKFI